MSSYPDLFGNVTKVVERKLRDPVLVRLRVAVETDDAIMVYHGEGPRNLSPTSLAKSLCDWNGVQGPARLQVERWKAEQMGWDYERI